jgi:phosphoglycolate phosphatase (TIGR01487 family)
MTDRPPLAVDVDGTLTRPDGPGLDPRVFDPLRAWPAPVVVATGKSFPYPIALCDFVGIDHRVVAENGGVVCVDDDVWIHDDAAAVTAVTEAFREAGGDLGWGRVDLVNRWRETELAVAREADEQLLRSVAAEYDLRVLDTGYAYHVTPTDVSKGTGLERVAELLDRDPAAFVAVGDSENDVSAFEVAGRSYAVANADDRARAAADVVVKGAHAEGFLAALSAVRERW